MFGMKRKMSAGETISCNKVSENPLLGHKTPYWDIYCKEERLCVRCCNERDNCPKTVYAWVTNHKDMALVWITSMWLFGDAKEVFVIRIVSFYINDLDFCSYRELNRDDAEKWLKRTKERFGDKLILKRNDLEKGDK